MSRLTDLIAKVKAKDPALGSELDKEFKILSSRLPFGLNFERHSPEAVELPLRPIRKGDKVRILPERGSLKKGDQQLWQVKAIDKSKKTAILELLEAEELGTQSVSLENLVVVSEFRDTIYPSLFSTGKVSRGGDKPYHTVINGENYHVLKALTYTHRGKIDVIYIDPPYNTGAKDWKYNNDYVEKDDSYRHSKWLAMIERRLLVAKELLNPVSSVMLITIDEKEYLRLGLLLEQLFPEATIQMISTVIAPQGSQRPGRFSRIEEYVFCVFFGQGAAIPTGDAMIATTDDSESKDSEAVEGKVTWDSLMRRGTDATRASREDMFYPITIDKETRQVIDVGFPPGKGNSIPVSNGSDPNQIVKWPIRTDGSEGRWQLGRDTFIDVLKQGMARVGRSYAVTYLKGGARSQILKGEIVMTGRDEYGYPVYQAKKSSVAWPRTIWNKRSHNASVYGSTLLRSLIPGRKFPFPKSLYAVEDTLRFFVMNKPDAIILDFFSGSGTTAHAVMRLNKQDGGCRQCISVTNNEVAADEQKTLRMKGLRPGDAKWELHGICDYITKPRIAAAITGKTPNGDLIKGAYKFTDEFPIAEGLEENAEFFTLSYESPVSVSYNLAFERISPLLWLRAGARGSRIDKLPSDGWAIADTYGLLNNVDVTSTFIKALAGVAGIRIAYIVTDDDRRFQAIAKRLPDGIEPVRLYESYLTNFSFTNGE
ncbi:DNA methyltransferase [Cronobacter sakazakii]|uniref:site-specific DNA-methyltransferase n=1 Tax=Cronobacter sakazakii TaxID=28141 RepID=UPI000CFCA0AD|nr:DNA methyltransferase [Cronobacter sakazakii]